MFVHFVSLSLIPNRSFVSPRSFLKVICGKTRETELNARCWMRVFALCISRPILEEFREKIFMNLPFDVGEYCLALNTRRGALHCHYFLFVMIRVQKPHGLLPHHRQCFPPGRNEHLMWSEVAAWCILSIFLSLDLGVLSLIATGDLYFLSSKRINKYGPQGQTCIFYIQISFSLNRYMKYSNNNHLCSIVLERSKCSELNRYWIAAVWIVSSVVITD